MMAHCVDQVNGVLLHVPLQAHMIILLFFYSMSVCRFEFWSVYILYCLTQSKWAVNFSALDSIVYHKTVYLCLDNAMNNDSGVQCHSEA